MTRQEIKLQAKTEFMASYGTSVAAYLIFVLIAMAATYVSAGVGTVILIPALMSGLIMFFIDIYARTGQASINNMFSKGFDSFGRKIGMFWWEYLFTFLWSLLFIVPGYIKSLSYSMSMYIISDSKTVKVKDAMKLSMRMTDGYLWEIFVYRLSFLGWDLLSGLTGGLLAILYVGPYRAASDAGLYLELKRRAIENGVIAYEELYPGEMLRRPRSAQEEPAPAAPSQSAPDVAYGAATVENLMNLRPQETETEGENLVLRGQDIDIAPGTTPGDGLVLHGEEPAGDNAAQDTSDFTIDTSDLKIDVSDLPNIGADDIDPIDLSVDDAELMDAGVDDAEPTDADKNAPEDKTDE